MNIFTFQYGSTQMDALVKNKILVNEFTFQYGSTQIMNPKKPFQML